MKQINYELIEKNLIFILNELKAQPEVALYYPNNSLSFSDDMVQISEYIELAGEYGLAYECIVGDLELFPFKLSGLAAVKLLEVGLLMGFKTGSDRDNLFDFR